MNTLFVPVIDISDLEREDKRTKASVDRCITEPNEMSSPFRDTLQPAAVGLQATLSEWTPGAIGWVLAAIVDCICTHAIDYQDIIIRITRTD